MVEQKEAMKQIDLSPRERAEILGVLFIDKELITSTQLNIIKSEIANPTYDYGAPDSVWELYNYVTFALKDITPQYWLSAQVNIHKYFVAEFNL